MLILHHNRWRLRTVSTVSTAQILRPMGNNCCLPGISIQQHPDRSLETEIFMVDINGKNLRMLFGEKGKVTTAQNSPLPGNGSHFNMAQPPLSIFPRWVLYR
jgi:hypothetical protein